MLRSIIIDDEPQSRMALKDALLEHAATIKVIAEANSASTAVDVIDNFQPDLVFLDIQLGDGSGFDVLEKTAWKKCKVVFVTAYNQYAIQAFRVNALDYLLKPINHQQLAEAVAKYSSFDPNLQLAQIQNLIQQFNSSGKKISFSTNDGYSIHYIDDIIHCESDNNYCSIYFTGNEKIYLAKTLKELEEQLAKHGFERVHQSHLVNMKHVKKYSTKEGGHLVMTDGTLVPVAHRKKPQLVSLLNGLAV